MEHAFLAIKPVCVQSPGVHPATLSTLKLPPWGGGQKTKTKTKTNQLPIWKCTTWVLYWNERLSLPAAGNVVRRLLNHHPSLWTAFDHKIALPKVNLF